jgi:hypothetical protein
MYMLRGLLIWLVIVVAESIHGTLRRIVLEPRIGDFTARRASFFTGMVLIFAVTYLCVRWIKAPSDLALIAVGFLWAALTILFEFGVGLFLLGYSYDRLFEDYDLSRGGFMGLGLVLMLFAPLLTTRLHQTLRRK